MNQLTVATSTHREPVQLIFTLQALRAMHGTGFDILVNDNSPDGCQATKRATEAVGGRYVHRPLSAGCAASKGVLFDLAETPWVLAIDAHVILKLGAVAKLLELIEKPQHAKDLLSGPIDWDSGQIGATHWRQTRPPGLWGVWDLDPRVKVIDDEYGGESIEAIEKKQKADLADFCRKNPGISTTTRSMEQLRQRREWASKSQEPFEIGMQGCGLFAMARDAFPGFHTLSRGFGGEEGYLHEKVRRAGGRAMCVPQLRWWHWFRDGSTTLPYTAYRGSHVFNLLVQHRELGIDAEQVIREENAADSPHFGGKLTDAELDQLIAEARSKQPFGVTLPPTRWTHTDEPRITHTRIREGSNVFHVTIDREEVDKRMAEAQEQLPIAPVKAGAVQTGKILPCRFRGESTGETATCASCNGNVQLKIFPCEKFTSCTLANKVEGRACCAGCTSREEPFRGTRGEQVPSSG